MEVKHTILIPVSKLETNNGQYLGLPKNPRDIYNDEFASLVESIKQDADMLMLRPLIVFPYQKKYIVIGGNMRLHAVIEAGMEEVPCKVLPENTPVQELVAMTILDNTHSGDWSEEDLDNDWSREELVSWSSQFEKEGETVEGEDEEIMTTLSLTFDAEDFKRVKQALNKIDKDNGKAALILFGYEYGE